MSPHTLNLEQRIAAIAHALAVASDDVAGGTEPGLDGVHDRAEAICRDIVEAPPGLARACAPALADLLARLDVLAHEVEVHREQLARRLAEFAPERKPST